MLSHVGLGCGSVAEHLPTVSKDLRPIPSTIKLIIHYGGLGVVVQTVIPALRAMLGLGRESRVTKVEASLGY